MIRIFGKDGEEIIEEKKPEEEEKSIVKEIPSEPPENVPLEKPEKVFKKAVNVEKEAREEQWVALPRGELFVVKQVKYALDGDPRKTIVIGVLNRTLNVEEVNEHRALQTECPYCSDCNMFVIKSNIISYTCSLCLVFLKHVLVKRKERS